MFSSHLYRSWEYDIYFRILSHNSDFFLRILSLHPGRSFFSLRILHAVRSGIRKKIWIVRCKQNSERKKSQNCKIYIYIYILYTIYTLYILIFIYTHKCVKKPELWDRNYLFIFFSMSEISFHRNGMYHHEQNRT